MIIKCPNCGKEYYDEHLSYCEECGMSLRPSSRHNVPNEYGMSEPKEINDHTLAIALGFIFAFLFPLIGLIFGVYLVTRKNSVKSKICGILVIIISIAIIWMVAIPLITNFYVISSSSIGGI